MVEKKVWTIITRLINEKYGRRDNKLIYSWYSHDFAGQITHGGMTMKSRSRQNNDDEP